MSRFLVLQQISILHVSVTAVCFCFSEKVESTKRFPGTCGNTPSNEFNLMKKLLKGMYLSLSRNSRKRRVGKTKFGDAAESQLSWLHRLTQMHNMCLCAETDQNTIQ